MLNLIKITAALFGLCLMSCPATGQTTSKLATQDFQFLNGLYAGTLTYRDYTSNETVTLQLVCNTYLKNNQLVQKILINEWGGNYEQDYKYTFKNGGIEGYSLVSSDINTDTKNVELIFSKKGRDGNKNRSCTFKYTLKSNQETYSITKEVKFDDEEDYFIRNQYRFERLNSIAKEDLGFK